MTRPRTARRQHNSRRRGLALTGALAVTAAALFVCAFAAAASAAEPTPLLWKKGENCGSIDKITKGECGFAITQEGSDIETVNPRGVVADPSNGHLYVTDIQDNRIVELTAWGQLVEAFGWGVRNGAAELQTCGPGATPPSATCLKGIQGAGAGQFNFPMGIAMDASGDLYVVDLENNRVQKFDSEGHFLAMFGGEVNETKVEAAAPEAQQNLCPVDPGDVCQAGTKGVGNGQFEELAVGSPIAVHGATVFVGDKGRVQKFDLEGHYEGSIAGPALAGEKVQSLAIDSTGALYLAFQESVETSKESVLKLDPSGASICTIKVKDEDPTADPQAIAVGPDDEVYVANGKLLSSSSHRELLRFNSECGGREVLLDEAGLSEAGYGANPTGIAIGAGCLKGPGAADVYLPNPDFSTPRPFIAAFGPPPDRSEVQTCLPPKAAPQIDDQYAVTVDVGEAILRAKINPHFWKDATYYVQYGMDKCS
jgi:DNA-binding beta-propeller fold protein YncE